MASRRQHAQTLGPLLHAQEVVQVRAPILPAPSRAPPAPPAPSARSTPGCPPRRCACSAGGSRSRAGREPRSRTRDSGPRTSRRARPGGSGGARASSRDLPDSGFPHDAHDLARARRPRRRSGRAGAPARGSGPPARSAGGPTRARRARPRPADTPGPSAGAGDGSGHEHEPPVEERRRRFRDEGPVGLGSQDEASPALARRASCRRARAGCPGRRVPTRSWVTWMPSRTVIHGGSARRPRSTALRIATAACAARRVASSTGSRPKVATMPLGPRSSTRPPKLRAFSMSASISRLGYSRSSSGGGPSITARSSVTRRGSQRMADGRRVRAIVGRGGAAGAVASGCGPRRRASGRDPPGRSRCLAIR